MHRGAGSRQHSNRGPDEPPPSLERGHGRKRWTKRSQDLTLCASRRGEGSGKRCLSLWIILTAWTWRANKRIGQGRAKMADFFLPRPPLIHHLVVWSGSSGMSDFSQLHKLSLRIVVHLDSICCVCQAPPPPHTTDCIVMTYLPRAKTSLAVQLFLKSELNHLGWSSYRDAERRCIRCGSELSGALSDPPGDLQGSEKSSQMPGHLR